MRHKEKLSKSEKIRRWLELCDFSYRLMSGALSKARLNQRFRKIREEHVKNDHRILRYLGKFK